MGKFLGFLIIVGGLMGTFFIFKEFNVKQKESRNRWISTLQPLIKMHIKGEDLSASEDPTYSAEGSFFRILAMMNEAERGGYSAGTTLTGALSGTGASKGEMKLIELQTMENYDLAKKFGVFNDPKNGLRMENGQPPVATAPGWDDEPLSVGHLLSPLIAPEAAKALQNLTLMPITVRNMQNGDLNGFSYENAVRWSKEKLISGASFAAIKEKIDAKSP
jgi:hypothetical protein